MNPEDREIRRILGGLRFAPVPEPPRIATPPSVGKRVPVGRILATTGMLLALVGVLYFVPGRSGDSKSAIASRLAAVEAKLAVIDHEELRELMRHEIGLLRLELEMTRSAEGRP